MKKVRKVIALLLICVLVISLAACGNGGTPASSEPGGGTPAAPGDSGSPDASGNSAAPGDAGGSGGGDSGKDTLRVAVESDRGTLDPRNLNATGVQALVDWMVYETLWIYDANGQLVMLMGESYEWVEPLRLHIKIKEGITFANGSPFTAEDVLFSCYLWNNRIGEAEHVRYFNYEESVVINDYECELVYDDYSFSHLYTLSSVAIFNKATFDPDTVSTETNGTGPYIITEYVPNSHMFLTLRDGYWGEVPTIKNIECRIIAEDTQMTNAVQTGSVDIARIPTQDVEFVGGLSDYNLMSVESADAKTLYFNVTENSIFYNNVDARKAVALAIDRESIVRIALNGYATVPRGPAPSGYSDEEARFLDMGVYGTGYDPDLAKEYAEKAGIVGKTIVLVCDTSSMFVTMAEIIQQNLRDIGVEMEIWSVDQSSWLSIFFNPWESNYDMGLDPILGSLNKLWAETFWTTHIYLLNSMYSKEEDWPGHERMMEIIGVIQTIPDAAGRSDMVYEMVQLQTEAMTYFALAQDTYYIAYSKDLKNFDDAVKNGGTVHYSWLHW